LLRLVFWGCPKCARFCISGAGFEIVMEEASVAVLVGAEGCVRERSALGRFVRVAALSSVAYACQIGCPS